MELFKLCLVICLAEDSMSNMMVTMQMVNKLPLEYPKDQFCDRFSLFYTLMTVQEHPTFFLINICK